MNFSFSREKLITIWQKRIRRIPKKLRGPLKIAFLSAAVFIGLYALIVLTALYPIYKRDTSNAYTRFAETIFPYPAAYVDHQFIPLSQFRLEVGARLTYSNLHGIQASKTSTEQFVSNELVNRILYAQALQDHHIVIQSSDVDTKMNDIIKQIGNQNALVSFLHENYGDQIGIAQFRTWVQESLVEAAVQNQVLENAHVSHILVAVSPNSNPDQIEAARQIALGIKAKITDPSQFAAIAKQYSEDVNSRDKGGDLGETVRGDTNPVFSQDFQNAIFSLPLNTVSDPIRSSFGWHLVIVTARTGSVKLSMKDYTNQLHNKYGVDIFIGK